MLLPEESRRGTHWDPSGGWKTGFRNEEGLGLCPGVAVTIVWHHFSEPDDKFRHPLHLPGRAVTGIHNRPSLASSAGAPC